MKVQMHGIELASRSNGPGLRAAIWFQGCTLHCFGCFNPETHDPTSGFVMETQDLAHMIHSSNLPLEGISISGGEPFQQSEALYDFLTQVDRSKLSVLVFTGYTLDEVKRIPLGLQILTMADALIAGRYQPNQPSNFALLGSSNQKIHLLTNRYRISDFASIPHSEVILHKDGTITITGVHPLKAHGATHE